MDVERRRALRVVVDDGDRPALQIARDLTLLHSDCSPTLRIYGWRPAGLSLGRFQDASAFVGLRSEHEIVRRPTGGGAIWHEDELTWALVLDDDPRVDSESWYARIHDAILRALRALGLRASRLETGPAHPGPRDTATAWCFARPCRGDLLGPCGRKLCGSAMRRIRAPRPRLLMHGSLMLGPPREGVSCASIADQADAGAVRVALREGLVRAIAEELRRSLIATPLTHQEEAAARARVDEVLVTIGAR